MPRAARRAEHVLAVSERTKRDAIALYGLAPEKITVARTASTRRSLRATGRTAATCSSSARSRRARTRSPRSRRRAPSACRSSSPARRRSAALARELRARGADVRGCGRQATARGALPRRGARSCSRRATRGSACRCSRRWRAARRSSSPATTALREVAGDAGAYAVRRRLRRGSPSRARRARAIRARRPRARKRLLLGARRRG